jgi:hypothetical protein
MDRETVRVQIPRAYARTGKSGDPTNVLPAHRVNCLPYSLLVIGQAGA